ncbi:unnamed protein product, partial [Owenia fusiformis]
KNGVINSEQFMRIIAVLDDFTHFLTFYYDRKVLQKYAFIKNQDCFPTYLDFVKKRILETPHRHMNTYSRLLPNSTNKSSTCLVVGIKKRKQGYLIRSMLT